MDSSLWVIAIAMTGLLVVSLIVLVKLASLIRQVTEMDFEGDMKLMLIETLGRHTENILFRMAGLEEKMQKQAYDTKIEMMEKLHKNNSDVTETLMRFQNALGESNEKTMDNIGRNLSDFNDRVDKKIEYMNTKIDERLNEGFERTNKTFQNIIERLSKIDEAQKKIDNLSTDIVSLQDVLTDKKSRGTFGEIQLNQILESIFGDRNDKLFQTQKSLPNGNIVDAVLHIPEPIGQLCIDSKFPLENYQKMIHKSNTDYERQRFEKEFKVNIKKHINDIAEKYIIPDVTSNQAIMFIPAEAIFAEINAYHQDLIDHSRKKRVWMASPTTLMSVLSTVQVVLKNIERDKYTSIIHEELKRLGEEFGRYRTRWSTLARDIEKVSKGVKEINITSDKIERRFNQISNVEIDLNEIKSITPGGIKDEQ
jgi:DNA recombination protein RmuC